MELTLEQQQATTRARARARKALAEVDLPLLGKARMQRQEHSADPSRRQSTLAHLIKAKMKTNKAISPEAAGSNNALHSDIEGAPMSRRLPERID